MVLNFNFQLSFRPFWVFEFDVSMVLSRISEEITKVEQTRVVNETMMASSVVTVHTAPDQSQADEGFYEPKQSQPSEKETYEASSPFLLFIYRIFPVRWNSLYVELIQ